jgi:hypothetical protein
MCENKNYIIWSIKMTRSINIIFIRFFCIIFFLSLVSCTGKIPLIASGVSGPEGLPIEEASRMDIKKSLVFGSDSEWFGRINLIVNMSGAEVFDFYRYEMPNFGWKEITSIRSDISLITYERAGRIANVRIDSSSSRGTEVWVTVSPRESSSNISK